MSVSNLFPSNFEPSQYTLLVVDDNPNNLSVIFDYLKGYGFNLLAARDGESGLKRAQYAQPDVSLLDVMMPGMDGFEVCRRLKQEPTTSNIPVIFMTALASIDDTVAGFTAGAVDYVTKPLRQEEALARITTHLRLRTLSRDLQRQNEHLQKVLVELEEARDLAELRARELTELNTSKDRFFSILAHDLRGPFTALLMSSQMIERLIDSGNAPLDRIKKMGQNIHQSSKNVAALLENLLEWSRLQLGRFDHKPMRLEAREVVDRCLVLFHDTAQHKGIELVNAVPSGLAIRADENMFALVVRNLVSNALKFTPATGRVTVSAQPDMELHLIQLSVSDTGTGIAPDDLNKLFKIGVHHTALGTNQEKGSGLGLLLCQEMAVLNGGRIWIESEVGQGTAVRFTVPRYVE